LAIGYTGEVTDEEQQLQLDDPITRFADDGVMADVEMATPPDRLDDGELRERLANLDTMLREAPDLGTEPHLVHRLQEEWTELGDEYHQRGLEPVLPRQWSADE
jgi:hypothetical protein